MENFLVLFTSLLRRRSPRRSIQQQQWYELGKSITLIIHVLTLDVCRGRLLVAAAAYLFTAKFPIHASPILRPYLICPFIYEVASVEHLFLGDISYLTQNFDAQIPSQLIF